VLPGRPPKATAIKLLQGNPGKRRLNDREPKPEQIEPQRPGILTEGGAIQWEIQAPILLKNKILTEADGISFALLCNDIAQIRKVNEEIEKSGAVITNPKSGATKSNPLVAQQSELCRRIWSGCDRFGMDPPARARLKTTSPDTRERREFDLDA
jgi:P27 family predicted phage terminase small subunit